jgi:hypothetical protein
MNKRKSLLSGLGHTDVDSALRELERTKLAIQQYQRWLTEFPAIILVLDNLAAVGEGKQSLCASNPPSPTGPWSTSSLREVLRKGTQVSA